MLAEARARINGGVIAQNIDQRRKEEEHVWYPRRIILLFTPRKSTDSDDVYFSTFVLNDSFPKKLFHLK